MAEPRKITILGAGIFGLAAAYACLQRGFAVEVLEKRHIGAGASGGLIGAMAPHMPEKWNAKKAFQLRALLSAEPFWRGIEDETGQSVGYARVGRVMPIAHERGAVLARERGEAAQTLWQGRADWRVEARAIGLPQGPKSEHGFACETLTARVNPRTALTALADAVLRRGGEIAEGVSQDPLDLANAGRTVVVAAGYESFPLMTLPFGSGVKGQAALLACDAFDDAPIYYEPGLYVVGHPGAGTAIGTTSESAWSEAETTDQELDALIERAREIFPILRDAPLKDRWAGVRPRARFPDPAIGPLPGTDGRIWLFSGGFKIGFSIAHEAGEALAAMLDGAEIDLPERFNLSGHYAQ